MAYEAENAIFQRLSQALTFHPASVSLFTPDWTLEPGDVVKVLSGEEEYDVPIYTMDLTWNGTAKTDIQSTGNQERQPLSALRRQEYQNARRGYGAARQVQEELDEQVHQYQHFVQETDVYRQSVYRIMGVTYDEHGNVIYQRDPVTGELILDEAGNPIPVYDETSNGSITGQVLQTAQNYTSLYQMTLNAPEFDKTATYHIGDMVMYGGVVYKFTAEHTGDWTGLDVAVVPPLQSQITQNAQEISNKVSSGDLAGYMTITAMQTAFGNTAVANNGTITKAEFSTSIVDGIATAGITADKILITGDTGIAGALTVAGYLFANDLFVENGAYVQDTIHVGGVHVYEDASFDGDITMTSTGAIETGTLSTDGAVDCGDNLYVGGDAEITGNLTVSGSLIYSGVSDIECDNLTATETVTAAAFYIDDGGTPRYISELPVTIGGDTVSDLSILATGEAESLAIPDAITDIQIVAPSSGSNVYTINKKTFHNTSWTEVGTFSRATTLTGGWGSSDTNAGMFSVDADPQEQHYKIKFNGTNGTADAVLDAVVGVGTPAASNTRIDFPIYIGTYTEGADMTTRVTLNRSVMISSELIAAWTQDGIDRGYIAGQANANARVNASDIIYNDYTAYISSTHTLQIGVFASPTLILKDQEGNETTSLKTGTEEIIEVETTVTAATLTSTYANGTYTVTKSSGGKVSVDGADIDVGVTSYPISASTAIADGRNSVEVGTASLDDPTFVTDTTQAHDRKYTISGTVQLDYQSGVDGSGKPIYTNIGNPVTIQAKNITSVYNDGYASGWGAAFGKVTLPASEQTTNAYMDVLTPPQTVDGSAASRRYTVSVDGSYAYIKTGNPAVTVARVANTGATVLYGEITGIILRSAGGVNYAYSDDDKEYTVYLRATGTNVSNSPYDGQVVISGSEAYSHGWGQAHNHVSIPTTQQTTNAYIDIGYPTDTVDGTAGSQRYTVSVDNDYAYIKAGNTTVARTANTGSSTVYGTITGVSLRNVNGNYRVYYEDDKEYDVYLQATGTNQTNSPYNALVTVSAVEAYNHGAGSVAPTGITLSTYTVNSSSNVRASLVVPYTGNSTGIPFDNVDVTEVYQAGYNAGTTTNSYPVYFDVTMGDGKDYTRTVSHVGPVELKDVYNAGANDNTPTEPQDYIYAPYGNVIPIRYATSGKQNNHLFMLYPKTRVERTGTSGNYIKVKYGDYTGYVYNTLVEHAITPTSPTDFPGKTGFAPPADYGDGFDILARTSTANVNLREGPTTSDSIIMKIASQNSILYCETDPNYGPSDQFTHVLYKMSENHYVEGYVQNQYIIEGAEPQPDDPTTKYIYASNGGAVNARETASSDGVLYGKLKPRTPVTVISGPTNNYYYVSYPAKTGSGTAKFYVAAGNLSDNNNSPTKYTGTGWITESDKVLASYTIGNIVHSRTQYIDDIFEMVLTRGDSTTVRHKTSNAVASVPSTTPGVSADSYVKGITYPMDYNGMSATSISMRVSIDRTFTDNTTDTIVVAVTAQGS